MDTYIGEFIRARTGFENDVADVEEIMKHEKDKGMEDMDKELYLKLSRFRHEIKLDSFKMLQDSALPLQVKKLKMERNKLRPKKPIPEIVHTVEPQQEIPQEEVDDGVQ
jgi:Tfp pilus assembly ATPase PilU